MGAMNHNAVIATTALEDAANHLQQWIDEQSEGDRELILRAGSWVNRYHTFIVVPDGSKEDWPESDNGEDFRKRLILRLSEDAYEDGSSPWDWVEIGFGEYGQKVLRGNCKNCFDDSEYAEQ